MMRHLQKLFSYDAWANREVLNVLQTAGTDRSRKLLAHILSAERLWLQRMQGKTQTHPVWPDFSLQQCASEMESLATEWKQRLDSGMNLDRGVSYKNSKGEAFVSREDDILLHVITHSAYHRGQIAADLRAAGVNPAYTDLIHGVRQGLVE